LGSTINRFRKKRLGLDKISLLSGASVLDRLKLPYIYCWSSELIPKPKDWMQNIDITGFLFLSSPDYQPESDLRMFLESGPTPIYVGFGSIVVDDPDGFTRKRTTRRREFRLTLLLTGLLLEAIKQSGVRALLSAGWSNMGNMEKPDNVFLLGELMLGIPILSEAYSVSLSVSRSGDIPHDWLFAEKRVSAVCIHGGAGTTAIALKNDLPVLVGESR
jgi:sterol 3beta-glucosyltransferase